MEINSNLFFQAHTSQILVTCLFLIVVFYIPAVESKQQGMLSQKTIFYFSLISHVTAFFKGFLRTLNLENPTSHQKKTLRPACIIGTLVRYAVRNPADWREEVVKIWREKWDNLEHHPRRICLELFPSIQQSNPRLWLFYNRNISHLLVGSWKWLREPWWSLLSPKDRVVKHPFFKWPFCWRKNGDY